MTDVAESRRPERVLTCDEQRGMYGLLIGLLSAPADDETLARVCALTDDGSELGASLAQLSRAAAATDADRQSAEFHELFVGLGGGTITPYASHYIAGSLHDWPLIELRQAMARLGIRRHPRATEPEDHVVTVREIMFALIDGRIGSSTEDAGSFYQAHLAPWLPQLFRDLERQSTSALYRAFGAVGLYFVATQAKLYGRAGDAATTAAGSTRISRPANRRDERAVRRSTP